MNYAEQGIQELSKYVDSLIIIPNDKLLKVLPKNTKMLDAFAAANNVLRNAVFGITDMITNPGLVNVDFADVHTVMSEMGRAMMGTGIHEGEGRAERAVQDAVASPLLEDVDLSGARGILVSITSGLDLEMQEVETIMEHIYGFASPDAAIVFGTAINPEMEGKLRVTLVATGLGQAEELKMPRTSFQSVQTVQQPVQQMASGQYQPQQQQPQAPSFAQPQQLAQPQQSFVSPEPQQTTLRQVDSAQMFSPSSIPGFLQKGQ